MEHLAAVAARPHDWWPAPEGKSPRIAVLIPCCDEEATIAQVVTDFQTSLPSATIYVYDNNSADRTAFVARAAGAEVRTEQLQGKGHVVRRMFADIDADVFLLVDGDGTYDAAAAPTMLHLLLQRQLDMVTATRRCTDHAAYRPGHRLGNAVLSALVRSVFGDRITDVLSGYRLFSRRFVKSFPALAGGFEIETEFTVHALQLEMPVDEIDTHYRERPAGSVSKLHTLSDGLRIVRLILVLVKEGRPLLFFATAGTALLLSALLIGGPVIAEFLRSGLVPKLPSAVLATGLVLLSSLTWVCGVVLDSVERGRQEMKRLAYLAVPLRPARDE
jgi:glycosyltransferase involved in cell wall biosynthesis